MLINDLIDIKNNNAKCILNMIRFNDGLTKKDIAALTNLSVATISNLSNELKAKCILTDLKMEEKRVGRIPNMLMLNYRNYLVVAIDLQLENTLGFAIVNIRNNIIFKERYDISGLKTAGEIAAYCKEVFDAFISTHNCGDAEFIGVGVAVPAVFDTNDGLLRLSALDIFERTPLKELLEKAFGMYVYVDNIANLCALSVYTRYKDKKNIVCMDISQGVGVGAITEGNLIRGKNGYATEVAHVPIGNPELVCPYCGGRGCVETELSLVGMTGYIPEIDKSLPLLERWERFIEILSHNTPQTEAVAQRIGSLTGRLATILINLFDPELFSISGYITEIFDRVEKYFYDEIELRCRMALDRNLKIEVERDRLDNVFIGIGDTIYDSWNPLL